MARQRRPDPYELTFSALAFRRAEAWQQAADASIRAIRNGPDDPEAYRSAIRAIAQLDEAERAVKLAEKSAQAPGPARRSARRRAR